MWTATKRGAGVDVKVTDFYLKVVDFYSQVADFCGAAPVFPLEAQKA
jgi:hypothetical protein